MKMFLNRITS